MRCRCCNREDANPRWDDWYCSTCETSIKDTSDFTMEDLYRIMEVDLYDLEEEASDERPNT